MASGVVRSELRPLRWIERPLKQRAKYRRLNCGPIQPSGIVQQTDLAGVQVWYIDGIEEPTIEARDVLIGY